VLSSFSDTAKEKKGMRFGRTVCVTIFFLILGVPSGLHPKSGPSTSEGATPPRFDGPAELPRVYVHSGLTDTPVLGSVRLVGQTDNLQNAIDEAKCGETLRLQAGATFSGKFNFPKKPCDDAHWIIIRTSASDVALPAEGTRMTPCYAGVASLPGRPDFHCSSPKNVMAKIVFDAQGDSGPIVFASGANHYRLIGLEITRAMPESHVRNLIAPYDLTSTADHLIFDRIWLHGTASDETKDGLDLSGVTYAAIVDSYVSDFHCIAGKGSCTDAQAVSGGTGDSPGGPYKIVNNFLEASGQSIMFGGGRGTTTPADIEIRGNHLFKPLIWKSGQAGFVGAYTGKPFIVKNHFELKNAQRVLFEGNVLENSWGGFTQTGFSIVLTPANQGGHCPECRVTDVTIRYNLIRHVASVVDIGNVTGKQKAASSSGERYSIHDLLADDIDGEAYSGFGCFAIIISRSPPLKSVHIDHVTAFPPQALVGVINLGLKIDDFQISNSIFTAGNRQVGGAGGGPENCAQGHDDPAAVLKNCFSNPTFSNNLIIGGTGGWPAGNVLVKDAKDAGFRDFKGGRDGDYRLCGGKKDGGNCANPSIALAKSSDGKAIGADIEAIEKATAGTI
jgi:hypothetical protein